MIGRAVSWVFYVFIFIIFVFGFYLGSLYECKVKFDNIYSDTYQYGYEAGKEYNYNNCLIALNRSMSETMVCKTVLDYCTIGQINETCYKALMEAR